MPRNSVSLPDFTQASISALVVVDPQPRRVLGANDELVLAGFGRSTEPSQRIENSCGSSIVWKRGRRCRSRSRRPHRSARRRDPRRPAGSRLSKYSPCRPRSSPHRARSRKLPTRSATASVLAHGQPRQLDPGGLVARLRDRASRTPRGRTRRRTRPRRRRACRDRPRAWSRR